MSDRADLFVARVARLKSIPEGVCTWEILNSYNELVSEARAIDGWGVVKEGPPLPAGTLMADSFEVIEASGSD
jgi:hypothetical protein